MAQLIDWLATSGARASAGDAVASGSAWFYEIGGGQTPAVVYTDKDATVVATQPVTLDAGGRATVYTKSQVRVLIQTSAGVTAFDLDEANITRAESVEVANNGFTGTLPNGSQGAGGVIDLDTVLDSAFASTGGLDFAYLESAGATARTIKSKFGEIWISVKDFGAKGDGLQVDTTAIQAAANRAGALGGAVVYFPPGTYKIDAAITVSGKGGVSFAGAGSTATVLKQSHASANGFTLSSCTGFFIRGMGITHTTSSTGTAIATSACQRFVIDGVAMDPYAVGTFRTGISITGDNAKDSLITSSIIRVDGNAAARCITYNTTDNLDTSRQHRIIATALSPGVAATAVEYNGTVGDGLILGCTFYSASVGVKFNASLTGTKFSIGHCPTLGDTSIVASPLSIGPATDPVLRQANNEINGYTVNVATGGNHTPDRSRGPEIRIRAITGAGTVTVNAPTPTPASGARNVRLTIKFVNAAGGAVTWAFTAATYLLAGAAVPANTDLHTITVELAWDPDVSMWREVCRADSTT